MDSCFKPFLSESGISRSRLPVDLQGSPMGRRGLKLHQTKEETKLRRSLRFQPLRPTRPDLPLGMARCRRKNYGKTPFRKFCSKNVFFALFCSKNRGAAPEEGLRLMRADQKSTKKSTWISGSPRARGGASRPGSGVARACGGQGLALAHLLV